MSVQGYLRVLKRSGEGGSLFPVKGSCRIGRSSQCDVRILLPDVAPVHCIITGDEHGQGLVQNKSLTKPTLVNGVPMAKNRVDLAHYDLITLADRTLRWEYLPNSPFYVMRAEGVHMSHLGSKDISGRMVTVPLSALQKSPTAHLATPKDARGRKSGVTPSRKSNITPSRNPITPLSSRKSNISPSRNPITPLSSRKSNALVAVVSPTRRNKEIQSSPSMEPELSELKPQPKKRVSLPVKKTITPLKSNNRRTLHGMPTVPTKSSPRSLHVIKLDTSPLGHPITEDGKSIKLKDIKIISKPTSTPLRKSTGARKSVPVKPSTPRPVARKSMPALILGLAHNASVKGSSLSSHSDRKSKSWKISDVHKTRISSVTTSPLDRKSKSWRTSDILSTSISSATKASKSRHRTSSVQSPETSTRQKGARTPQNSSGVFSPKKSLKSTPAKDLKRTPGSSSVTSPLKRKSKSWRTSDIHSTNISSATKASKGHHRTSSVQSSETSTRQKGARTPQNSSGVFSPKKSLESTPAKDLKRTPGSSKIIVQKEFKTLIPRLVPTASKRKFEDDLVSAERAAKRMKMVKSPKSPDKKKMAAILQCHGKSPHNTMKVRKPLFSEVLKTSIARKKVPKYQNLGRSRPAPNKKKPVTTSLKLTTVVPKSFQFNSTGHADSPETIIIRKGNQLPTTSVFKSPLSAARRSPLTPKANSQSIPSDPSISLPSTSGLCSSFTTTPILKKKSLASFDISSSGTPSRKSVHFSTTNLTSEATKSPRKGRLSLVEKSLASPEECRGFLPESSGRKSIVGTPSSAQKITPERSSDVVGGDRSTKKSLTRRLSESHKSSDSESCDEKIHRKSGGRKSLVSNTDTSIATSDSETPTRKVSRGSKVRKSLISPGEPLSGLSPVDTTTSDSENLNRITSRRSGARRSFITPVESLNVLSPVATTTSDSENSDKITSRRSGARRSIVTPVESLNALSPVEITRSGARKSIVAPVEPLYVSSPIEITLDYEAPNRMSRRSGARQSLIAPVETLNDPSPVDITMSDSETVDKITSRKSGARKSLIAPVEPLFTPSPVEKIASDSNAPNKMSRRSGSKKSFVVPVEPLSALSPVEITSDSETPSMSRRSGARKSVVAPVEPVSAPSHVEITSDSEPPSKITSRRSGARKSVVAPVELVSAPSHVEITSDSETPSKITSRRSGARKSIVAPVEPVRTPSHVEITSDSETPSKITSRRSGARKSVVAPVEPVSAPSHVEITSDSENPSKITSRRSGARKSVVAPVEPVSAPSQVEITSDSETPNKITSRRSGARKSVVTPVMPLSAPSHVEITSDSEAPNKMTSRRSGARKSVVAPVEPVSAPSQVEITSDSEPSKITSRRSGARKSIVAPMEPVSALSYVEITSDSETPNKITSRRSGARKSGVAPVEPVSAPSHVEITSDSETPNKISSRGSGARKSVVAPVEPVSAPSHVEITSDSETPNKTTFRRSGARESIVAPVETLYVPPPIVITLDSEAPNKMSRRSGARKSFIAAVEPLYTPSPVEKIASDSNAPNKMSRRSGVVPVGPLSALSPVEKITSDSETPNMSGRSGARKSIVASVEPVSALSHVEIPSDSETPNKITSRRSGARKSLVPPTVQRLGFVLSDSESPQKITPRRSGARNSPVVPVEQRRSINSRKSIKSSPIQEMENLTDSTPSDGKHSKSGKSLRSSIQLKFGELNTRSSPKSSSKRPSRRSSLLFKKDNISTPMKIASKSISPLMRSAKLQQENGFNSLSSSVRCEASTSSVLGISLTESELSLLVSPESRTSSSHSGRKRSIDMLSDEEDFPSSKRRSTSVNNTSAATSFDFSAIKTPSVEKEFYVSPLSATSNAGLWTSPRKILASGQRLSKASLHRSSSKGSLPYVRGVKRLQRSPKNDLSDIRGVGKLLRTPRPQQSPKNDLRDVRGVKKLLGSPSLQRSPKNDLRDVRGVKKLLGSPRLQRSPKNDLSDVRGVKKLLGSPRLQRSPKNDLSDVRGVRKVFGSPSLQRSPKNDLSDVRGVKTLLGSPLLQKSPMNDLSDVRGVKTLLGSPRLQRSPKNDLRDVRGVKKLLGSPRLQRSPKNDLRDVRGVKKLLGSPRLQRSPKNDLRDVRGVKKLLGSPRPQRSPKNDLTRIEGVRELFKNSSVSHTSRNTSSDSLYVTDLKQLFNSSPKSSSASFENSSELSGASKRGRHAEIGRSHSTGRRPDDETRPDSRIVEESESSFRAASATKTKKGHVKTSSNTELHSPNAVISAAEKEEITVSELTQVASPIKTRRGKANATMVQLAAPETFSRKREGTLDVEDSSGASILRTQRAAGGKREVQTETVSPRKTRAKVAGKETNKTKLIADQENINNLGNESKTRSNKIVFNSPVKQIEVNPETTNLENQHFTKITSAQKKRGRTASKPDDQFAQESLPKTRTGRAAAKRVDAETSKISTTKSPVQKRRNKILAQLESNTAEESSSEMSRMKRRGDSRMVEESESSVRDASATKTKKGHGKTYSNTKLQSPNALIGAAETGEITMSELTQVASPVKTRRAKATVTMIKLAGGRMADKFESLAAGDLVLDALGDNNKENDKQISGKSILRSPNPKRKKGIASKFEPQVTEELVTHTPDRIKRGGRRGANQDAEKVVPGTADQKRRGRAAAQTDKFHGANSSLSKSPEQRKSGNTLVNLKSDSTSESTSDASKRRGRAATTKQEPRPASREHSKSPKQRKTGGGEAKFEIPPSEAPTSGRKRRVRGAKLESETTEESTLNSSNQTRRGRRAAAAVGLKSQSTDESPPEISLQQEKRLSAEMELPRPKMRGRVAAEVESQPNKLPNSSDHTRRGRTAAKSESQTSSNQKKEKSEASLKSQPIVGSPNVKKRGRAAAEHEAHTVDTLPSPPKRAKRGRVAADVDGMAPEKSLGGLADGQTVPSKVSKQNKSSSTKKGSRTSNESQTPERVLRAASDQKLRRGRTVAEVVETHLVPATKTKVKSQTPSPRKTRSRK